MKSKKPILSGVYKISNIIDSRIYIGSSKNIHERWKAHLKDLIKNNHHSKHLQRFVNKYSRNTLIFEIIELCKPDKSQLLVREQYHLDTLKPQFNNSPTARSCLGYKHTEEARQNMANSQKSFPVAQYDLTGKFIKSYKSAMEAERHTKISSSAILRCIKGFYSKTNNFMWKLYENCEDIPAYIPYKKFHTQKGKRNCTIAQNKPELLATKQKKINQYDMENNFIKTWDSIRQASRELNLDSGSISRVCQGLMTYTKGFKFKYY